MNLILAYLGCTYAPTDDTFSVVAEVSVAALRSQVRSPHGTSMCMAYTANCVFNNYLFWRWVYL